MSIEEKLNKLGISLPPTPTPVGAYVPAIQSQKLVFISGQIPMFNGKVQFSGKVGREVDLEQAQEAARLCAVNALAVLQAQLGSLDSIRRIVRLEIFVNSAKSFTDQSQVANGASNLFGEIFGDAGQHARLTVGVSELPLGAAVELALIAEIK
jgi:enamine deaminase RidA (YjgF/YER057c/UK114 family)